MLLALQDQLRIEALSGNTIEGDALTLVKNARMDFGQTEMRELREIESGGSVVPI